MRVSQTQVSLRVIVKKQETFKAMRNMTHFKMRFYREKISACVRVYMWVVNMSSRYFCYQQMFRLYCYIADTAGGKMNVY